MKRSTKRFLPAAILAACFGPFTASSQATMLGYNTDPAGPLWSRGDPNTAYATWDTFSGFSFSGAAPDSTGGFSTASLSQSQALTGNPGTDQGAGVYNNVSTATAGNDVLYPGGLGLNFSESATTPFDIGSVYLQIKNAGNSPASLSGVITPTLDGIAADSVSSISGSGDTTTNSPGYYSVTTWYWGSSLGSNVTSLDLAFSLGPHGGAVDGISVDAGTPVPEPAAMGIAAAGGVGLLLRRRRKQSNAMT